MQQLCRFLSVIVLPHVSYPAWGDQRAKGRTRRCRTERGGGAGKSELAVVKTEEMKPLPAELEQVLVSGDLKALTPAQRVEFYGAVCKSLGLNPLTKPFEYVNLNGKLTLYAKKDCTDQLRKINSISVRVIDRSTMDGVLTVTVRAWNQAGREDELLFSRHNKLFGVLLLK